MNSKLAPTCIIYRLKGEGDHPAFVELPIVNGELQQNRKMFSVSPGDSYLRLKPSQIVFAYKSSADRSIELDSFSVTLDGKEADVEDMPFKDLRQLIDWAMSQASFTTIH